MPANWSLILNILLLIGVIVAIGRLMKARKQSLNPERYQPTVGKVENSPYDAQPMHDDIIAVRKVNREAGLDSPSDLVIEKAKTAPKRAQPQLIPLVEEQQPTILQKEEKIPSTVMMFLLAKEHRQFAGYELLQVVLTAGLRFGEGHLFHRHQHANGDGSIVCSLASATATGVFDLQNIGAFNTRGLCLFMQTTKKTHINAERFAIMLETAKQLSERLDAYLLDDQRRPLNTERLVRYYNMLHLKQEEQEEAIA